MKNHIAEFIKQLPPEYDKFINIITEIHLENDEFQAKNKRLRKLLIAHRICPKCGEQLTCSEFHTCKGK